MRAESKGCKIAVLHITVINACDSLQEVPANCMHCAAMQEYEAVLDQWMAEFHYLLTYNNAALAESDPEKENVVDAVKAAVCDNIYLFIQINEDEFEKYLKTFAQDVWTELTKVSLNPGQVMT